MMILKIFLTFFKIGAFSFGGGYAVLAFIEKEIVGVNGWLSSQEFIDLVALSQITPGPIAINSSTYAGFKTAGIAGAVSGTIGVTAISYILVVATASKLENMKDAKWIQWIFLGLRPAVIGLIASAAYSIAHSAVGDVKGVVIALFSFFMIIRMKWHPILVIALSGGLGVLLY